MIRHFSFPSQEKDEVPVKGMKNIYSYAKLILMQKKDSHMVHDDIREEYLQSPQIYFYFIFSNKCYYHFESSAIVRCHSSIMIFLTHLPFKVTHHLLWHLTHLNLKGNIFYLSTIHTSLISLISLVTDFDCDKFPLPENIK